MGSGDCALRCAPCTAALFSVRCGGAAVVIIAYPPPLRLDVWSVSGVFSRRCCNIWSRCFVWPQWSGSWEEQEAAKTISDQRRTWRRGMVVTVIYNPTTHTCYWRLCRARPFTSGFIKDVIFDIIRRLFNKQHLNPTASIWLWKMSWITKCQVYLQNK